MKERSFTTVKEIQRTRDEKKNKEKTNTTISGGNEYSLRALKSTTSTCKATRTVPTSR